MVFRSRYADLEKHSGETVEVVRPTTEKEKALYGVEDDMYKIRFADGSMTDAYADELTER